MHAPTINFQIITDIPVLLKQTHCNLINTNCISIYDTSIRLLINKIPKERTAMF